jgi:hypothetical protein
MAACLKPGHTRRDFGALPHAAFETRLSQPPNQLALALSGGSFVLLA